MTTDTLLLTPEADETTALFVPDTPALSARNARGAPRGNRNRIASGLRSFVLGRYPKGCSYVARQGHLLRRQLRQAVTENQGSTNVWSEAVIASACQHECRRLLLLRWLRLEGDGLKVLDRAALLDRIGAATDSRDRCLKLLGLDVRHDASPEIARLVAILDADECSGDAPAMDDQSIGQAEPNAPESTPDVLATATTESNDGGDRQCK